MKNKYLLILFAVFIIAVLLSIFISRQSQKAVAVSPEQPAVVQGEPEVVINQYVAPGPAAQPLQVSIRQINSGITVLGPAQEDGQASAGRITPAADKASNVIFSAPAVADDPEPVSGGSGITEIDKRPPPEEAKEMNSRGIVLY